MRNLLTMMLMLAALLATSASVLAGQNVRDLGLTGDGETNDTEALQAALDDGHSDLYFPAGEYVLGTVRVPGDTTLRFGPKALVTVESPEQVTVKGRGGSEGQNRVFLVLEGDRITIDGLNLGEKMPNLAIFGDGRSELTFRGLRSVRPLEEDPRPRNRYRQGGLMIDLYDCHHVVLENSTFQGVLHGLRAYHCSNVTVRGNRMTNGNTLTTFDRGSESLRHHDNWSRMVVYQCVFRGGSPDPSRKSPRDGAPLGSARTALRGLDPKDERYGAGWQGVFDISIKNNYAEYGQTLAWGNRGRQVVFEGNIARFMTDYCYGVEACQNVVFANNVAINGRYVGIMSMYWGESLIVQGNKVIVRDEPYDERYLGIWGNQQLTAEDYQGYALVRFHHGPMTAEDTAAGSRYGGGKGIITGNLLLNERPDRVRTAIRLEGGRDVLISGNKIVNGMIHKEAEIRHGDRGGEVTIIGNDFLSDLPMPHSAIRIGTDTRRAAIKNNVMRFTGGRRVVDGQVIAEDDARLRTDLFDDAPVQSLAERDDADELPPAIATTTANYLADLDLMTIEGNTIEGWPTSIGLRTLPPREPARFVVRNNNLDGAIQITAHPDWYRSHLDNNLHLETFETVDAEHLPHPEPLAGTGVRGETGPTPGKDWTAPAADVKFVWIEDMAMWVGKYEVTNEQYRQWQNHRSRISEGGAGRHGDDFNAHDAPANWMNFATATQYAAWLTEQEEEAGRLPAGYRYRLPSEDEWKTFAGTGTNRTYPWGDVWPPTRGNYRAKGQGPGPSEPDPGIEGYESEFPVTAPVQKSGENEWGLFGVGGNLWEATTANHSSEVFGSYRGGSWATSDERFLKIDFGAPAELRDRRGFRLVLSP